MVLDNPHALWLLLLLPFLGRLFRYRLKHQATLPHPDLRLLQKTGQRQIHWADRLSFWGRALILLLLILAVARPRLPLPGSRIPSEGIAIVLVMDVSGSMGEKDFIQGGTKTTRLQAAKEVLTKLVRPSGENTGRRSDAIGLVTFASGMVDVAPPSVSHDSMLALLQRAQPIGQVPDSATNIGDALAMAMELLQRLPIKTKAILLVTDGEHNVPPEVDALALKPREAAQLAAGLQVHIHPLFLSGSTTTGPSAQNRLSAIASLSDVAQMTGGSFYEVTTTEALQVLTSKLDTMERSRIETFQYQNYLELYPILGFLALALLIAKVVLEETWLRTLP